MSPMRIRQICPDTLLWGHCSGHLTSARFFTIWEHYIASMVRCLHFFISPAAGKLIQLTAPLEILSGRPQGKGSKDLSVTKICGRQVGHAANSSAWPSARSGTGAEVP